MFPFVHIKGSYCDFTLCDGWEPWGRGSSTRAAGLPPSALSRKAAKHLLYHLYRQIATLSTLVSAYLFAKRLCILPMTKLRLMSMVRKCNKIPGQNPPSFHREHTHWDVETTLGCGGSNPQWLDTVYWVIPSSLIGAAMNLNLDPSIKDKLLCYWIFMVPCKYLTLWNLNSLMLKIAECGSGWLERNGDYTARLIRLIFA